MGRTGKRLRFGGEKLINNVCLSAVYGLVEFSDVAKKHSMVDRVFADTVLGDFHDSIHPIRRKPCGPEDSFYC